MLVLLGEVGGIEEYEVVEALKTKRIVKPIVAWCIGTCAGEFVRHRFTDHYFPMFCSLCLS